MAASRGRERMPPDGRYGPENGQEIRTHPCKVNAGLSCLAHGDSRNREPAAVRGAPVRGSGRRHWSGRRACTPTSASPAVVLTSKHVWPRTAWPSKVRERRRRKAAGSRFFRQPSGAHAAEISSVVRSGLGYDPFLPVQASRRMVPLLGSLGRATPSDSGSPGSVHARSSARPRASRPPHSPATCATVATTPRYWQAMREYCNNT